jgi:DNA-directed RNA polymerase specialized sigma24 family protein
MALPPRPRPFRPVVRISHTCCGSPPKGPQKTIYSDRKPNPIHLESEQPKICGTECSQANKPGRKEDRVLRFCRRTNNFKLNAALAVPSACTLRDHRRGHSLEIRMVIPPVTQEPQIKPRERRSKRKSNWTLTQESIDKLLAHLGEDHETAGLAYQELRSKLIIFFECNRSTDAEELADVTLNRIARKLCDGESIKNPMLYALSVARYVLCEYWRRPELSAIPLDESVQEFESNYSSYAEDARAQHEAEMRREECMRRCLMKLPAQERKLLIDYYWCQKGSLADHRKKMAARMRITPNALSIQVHRLRGKLINSLEESLKRD